MWNVFEKQLNKEKEKLKTGDYWGFIGGRYL
jgi:hypothetical protein